MNHGMLYFLYLQYITYFSSKSMPLQYSNTVANELISISKTSNNCTTRGCFISLCIVYSRVTCFIYDCLRSSDHVGLS